MGGYALKYLFGSATIADLRNLHVTLQELQGKHFDVVHSLSDQLTYIKKLNTLTQENAHEIMTLSSIVKDEVIQSHDRFQQVMRDIVWLNATLQGQSEQHAYVRQLEFALLGLT